MHIVLNVGREIIVDDELYVIDICSYERKNISKCEAAKNRNRFAKGKESGSETILKEISLLCFLRKQFRQVSHLKTKRG